MSNKYLDIAMEKVIKQEVNVMLDKIRSEIDKIYERENHSFDCLDALDELKEFIDKYKAGSENKDEHYMPIKSLSYSGDINDIIDS